MKRITLFIIILFWITNLFLVDKTFADKENKKPFMIMTEVNNSNNKIDFLLRSFWLKKWITKYNTNYSFKDYLTWPFRYFDWPDVCFETNPRWEHMDKRNWIIVKLEKKWNWFSWNSDMWTRELTINSWKQKVCWYRVWAWDFRLKMEKSVEERRFYDSDAYIYN